MARTFTLQPAMTGDRMPYPFHVDAEGRVQRQDFWRGNPLAIIGITRDPRPGRMDAVWTDVVDDIERVLGTYLVVTDADGQWSTLAVSPIDKVVERDAGHAETFRADGSREHAYAAPVAAPGSATL